MFNKKLRLQIAAMEARLEEQTGILNGFAKDIDELADAYTDMEELVETRRQFEERTKKDIDELKDAFGGMDELAEAQRQAFEEQIRKDICFQNMMNY